MLNGLNVHYICSVSHITVSRILELCFACCITQRQSDGSSKDDPAQKLLLWRLLLRQLLQVRPGGQHSQANSQERRYLVDLLLWTFICWLLFWIFAPSLLLTTSTIVLLFITVCDVGRSHAKWEPEESEQQRKVAVSFGWFWSWSGEYLGRELQGGSECNCCYKGPDNMLHRYPGAVYPIYEVIFIQETLEKTCHIFKA